MNTELIGIRNQQRDTWNKFSGGWKKYDDFNMNFLKPTGNVIIRQLNLQKTDKVLDIASGTGEPALTIATIVSEGKVTATDLSEYMLDAAKDNAQKKGIKNFETVVADVCELPFNDSSFNKISCRMGFMFFPDMQLAAGEIYRVLTKGGKMATSVWYNPKNNAWVAGIMSIINKNMQLPQPPAGAPSMFRCAQPALITSILGVAGFSNIQEHEIKGTVQYDDFNHYWEMMNEVAAPVVGALSKADNNLRTKIKDEVKAFANEHIKDGKLALDYCALVVSAVK